MPSGSPFQPAHDATARSKEHTAPNARNAPSAHQARPHPDRARQFMPFAALKGYYELVRKQERVAQPQHQLTEEEARELSERLSALRKGELAQVTYYDTDSYVTMQGIVTRIDTVFRILRVVKTDIPFDSILGIESGGVSRGQERQA